MTKTMTKNNISTKEVNQIRDPDPPTIKEILHSPLIYMVYGESDLSCSSNVGTCGKLLKSSDDNFDSKMFNAPGLEAGESCRAPQAITH